MMHPCPPSMRPRRCSPWLPCWLTPPLAHPHHVSLDGSDVDAGAVLEQFHAGKWIPLSIFSKHFTHSESCYSAFNQKLLAAYLAVCHFQVSTEGQRCYLSTNHKPLIHSWHCCADLWSSRQQLYLATLSEFLFDVIHRPGKDNIVADSLTCSPVVSSVTLGLDIRDSTQLSCRVGLFLPLLMVFHLFAGKLNPL